MAVTISPLNPFHFVKVRDTSPRIPDGTMYETLQRYRFRRWEQPDRYYQKVRRGFPFRLHINVTDYSAISLIVRDELGKEALAIDLTVSVDIAGNVDDNGNQYHSLYWALPDLSDIAEDGYYDLYFKVTYFGGAIDEFVSEPFHLKDSHEGTLYWEWTQQDNKDGFYFAGRPMRLNMLVEGTIGEYQPTSVDVVFDDQNYDPTLLNSEHYDGMKLRVGGNGRPISDWMLKKMTCIFGVKQVYINSIQYRRPADAKWEPTRDLSNPLMGAALDIRLADNSTGASFPDKDVFLYNTPGFPYAIQGLWIGHGGLDIQIGGAAEISDGTVEAAYIAGLNAALSDMELYGSVANTGGRIAYINGSGEDFNYGLALIHTTFFTMATSVSSGAPTLNRIRSFTLSALNALVTWGDGAADAYVGTANTTLSASHVYGSSGGSFTVKVWGDWVYKIVAGSIISLNQFTNFAASGSLPSQLRELNLTSVGFPSNTFDFAVLLPCASSIRKVVASACGITTIASGMNSYLFPALSQYDFSFNFISSAQVSAMMYDVWYNSTGHNTGVNIVGGKFSIISQSPSATLNWVGTLYKGFLTGSPLFWTVNN